MENVVLVDYDSPEEWGFHRALEESTKEKWNICKEISNMNQGGMIQNIIRYIKYFIVPLKYLFRKNNYSKIVAWQQFYGLVLAFYSRLFRIKKMPEIYVMTFIYKPKNSLVGKIYHRFINYCVTSRYIDRFIIFSKSEQIYYSELFHVNKEKFVYTKLGYEDKTKIIPSRENEGYFLTAGRSNRDYNFLINYWKERNEEIYIIADSINVESSNNMKVFSNCYDEEYLKLLAGAKAVIIPLDNEQISSGQLVIIQSMMYGKPVISTYNDTVVEYIKNDLDGFVINKSFDELNKVIDEITDENIYRKISKNARNCYLNNYSDYAMGKSIGEIIVANNT